MEYSYLKTKNGENIKGPIVIKQKIFSDNRGFFMESWNQKEFNNFLGKEINFVQDNHSHSIKGVIRGMHYQKDPYSQGKLIRCLKGKIFDVVIDIRIKSKTFGEYGGVFLDSIKHNQLWIPEGFAHGFLTISDYADVLYKTNSYWNNHSESSIHWNDPNISIDWPDLGMNYIVSSKDKVSPFFEQKNNLEFFS
tara:strand:- start:725 stop:1303 length:579 start_codon:yes stop_codon:yes gene_type:complete